ncbi:MAG: S8 family serine peptidase [Bacteroidota bacterium]|nr:S8 family serine peptidase [Bacteroidota bacterium]
MVKSLRTQITLLFLLFSSLAFGQSKIIASVYAIKKAYLLLQFNQTPSQQIVDAFTAKGYQFDGLYDRNIYYISKPYNAAIIEGSGATEINMFTASKYKTNSFVASPASWYYVHDSFNVRVSFFSDAEIDNLKIQVSQFARITNVFPKYHYMEIRIAANEINRFNLLDMVKWLEPIHPPLSTDNLPGKTLHHSNILQYNLGFTGSGIKVGEWDGGFVGQHIDHDSRKTILDYNVQSDHATHVAGTIVGNGTINPYATGMAPNAILYSSDFYGNIVPNMDSGITKYGMDMTSNSYGYSPAYDTCPRGQYDDEARAIDLLVNYYPNYLHVFAAGNAQSNCGNGGYGTIPSGWNSSKNVVTVGAVSYIGTMSTFSSFGPTRDGRLKPDICADGVGVYSTLPNNNYQGGWNGTSMATPGVTGTAAQLVEYYKSIYNTNPDAILMKGILCNTADDAGAAHVDFKFGYGNINAIKAYQCIHDSLWTSDTISNGNIQTYNIYVDSNMVQFRAMLNWMDVEGNPAAQKALVNDLDLYIITPASDTIYPWKLNPASPATAAIQDIDTLNNMEQVTIDTPQYGNYIIVVKGTSVAMGPQKFYIHNWQQKPELKLLYPNGGEHLDRSSTQVIRWQSAGVTGTYDIYYSMDSGVTYTGIVTGIANNIYYYDWTVPNTASSDKVYIKVVSSALSDSSDAAFTIMRGVSGLTATSCSGSVILKWASTGQAAKQIIYRQFNNNWVAIDTINNTTSYTDTNVVNGQSYWYTIRHLSSADAYSERAYAVKGTPNNIVNGLITSNKSHLLYCGDSMILTATTGSNYSWTPNGETKQTIKVKQAGDYAVSINNSGCLLNSSPFKVLDGLSATVTTTTICKNDTVILEAQSPQLNTIRFTELIQNMTATGATSPMPSWITTQNSVADFVEVTNMGTDTMDLGNITFELWNSSSILSSFAWPSYAKLLPDSISVLHIGNSGTDDSTHLFYNTGVADDQSSSGDPRGYILKQNGNIIDAVAVNGYAFPTTAKVSNVLDWEGQIISMSGRAGCRLKGADNNNQTNWSIASATNITNLGTLNPSLVSIPTANVSWSDGQGFTSSNAKDTLYNITSNKTITLTFSTANCSQQLSYNINTISVGQIAASKDTICAGDSMQLSLTNNSVSPTWEMNTGNGWQIISDTTSQLWQTLNSSTWYRASITTAKCGTEFSDSIYIYTKPLPTNGNLVKSRDSICMPDTVSFSWSGSNGSVQEWYYNDGSGWASTGLNGNNINTSISASGWMIARIGYNNGCMDIYDSIWLNTQPRPYIGVLKVDKDTVCAYDSFTLSVDTVLNGTIYIEEYEAATSNWIVLNNNGANYYTYGSGNKNFGSNTFRARVSSKTCGDVYTKSLDVVVNPINILGSVSATMDTVCSGDMVHLTFNPGGTQPWYNQYPTDWQYMDTGSTWISLNDNSSMIMLNPTMQTKYRAYFTTPCDTDEIIYSIYIYKSASKGSIIASKDSVCEGDTFQLTSMGHAGTVTWQMNMGSGFTDFASGDSVLTVPFISAYYRAKTELSPCDSAFSDTLYIYVEPQPMGGKAFTNQTNFCSGDSVSLYIMNHYGSPSWQIYDSAVSNWVSMNVNGDSIKFLTATSAWYRAAVSNNFCKPDYSQPVFIQIDTKPVAGIITADKDSVCGGNTINLKLNKYSGQITWQQYDSTISNWKTIITSIDSISVSPTSSYYIRAVLSSGSCGDDYTSLHLIKALPAAVAGTISSSANNICVGNGIALTLSGNTGNIRWQSYDSTTQKWVNLGTKNPITVYPYGATRYRAVSSISNCTAISSEIKLTTMPSPTVNVTASGALTFCQGSNVVLNSSQGNGWQYQWMKDTIDISGETQKSYAANTAGVYQVRVTGSNGCTNTSGKLTTVVNPTPAKPVVTRVGNNLQSSATTNIQWYKDGVPLPGSTNQNLAVSTAGSYTIKVTNSFGCTSMSVAYTVTGITEISIEKVLYIYPNPTSNITQITLPVELQSNTKVNMIDIHGRIVQATYTKINEKTLSIELSNFAQGMYIIEVCQGNGCWKGRVVKE